MPDQYHEDVTHDSHSSLQLFRWSVEAYAAVRVYKTMPPREPTPAMILGSALHCRVLEESEFGNRYVVAPEIDRRTKAGKAEWEAFVSETNGKTVITKEDAELVEGMFQGVMRNHYARRFVEADGEVEKPVYGTDSLTGLPIKCRPDKKLANELIGDFKTDSAGISPDRWSMTVANMGYDAQGALYMDVAGGGPFVWFVVDNKPPHECAVYSMGEAFLAIGRHKNRTALVELAERKRTNDWTGRYSATLEVVEPQPWYARKFEVL